MGEKRFGLASSESIESASYLKVVFHCVKASSVLAVILLLFVSLDLVFAITCFYAICFDDHHTQATVDLLEVILALCDDYTMYVC